ncbi:hypothetical protein Droror1_Dr00027556 [Drosera rotundifolia]
MDLLNTNSPKLCRSSCHMISDWLPPIVSTYAKITFPLRNPFAAARELHHHQQLMNQPISHNLDTMTSIHPKPGKLQNLLPSFPHLTEPTNQSYSGTSPSAGTPLPTTSSSVKLENVNIFNSHQTF